MQEGDWKGKEKENEKSKACVGIYGDAWVIEETTTTKKKRRKKNKREIYIVDAIDLSSLLFSRLCPPPHFIDTEELCKCFISLNICYSPLHNC